VAHSFFSIPTDRSTGRQLNNKIAQKSKGRSRQLIDENDEDVEHVTKAGKEEGGLKPG